MLYEPLVVLGAATLRSVFGWLENSLRDGKIENFEWKLLGESIVKVGLLGAIALYFPGLNLAPLEASAVALGGDLFLRALKTVKK